MNFEVLKRSHLKRNIIKAVLVVAFISSLILNFTQAKYRVTESMPLIQGTINFSLSDLNLMAVYLNKNGETISSDKVPHVGYTLNTEQSICEVNDVEDENIEIVYENGLLNFNGLGNKGTSNSNPSLQCDSQDVYTTTDSSSGNKSLQYPIGLVTADEAALAGATWNNPQSSYLNTGEYYWTMSPSSFNSSTGRASVFVVSDDGNISSTHVDDNYSRGVRPVINLKSAIVISGIGTTTDPFVVVL